MKTPRNLALTVLLTLALGAAGCGGKANSDATQPLQESFKAAEPEVQKTIASVNASLNTGNYAEATRALAPLVTDRPMTDAQKQAVGVALKQINQAVAANPALDTKEMYELRARMFKAVHSGPRF